MTAEERFYSNLGRWFERVWERENNIVVGSPSYSNIMRGGSYIWWWDELKAVVGSPIEELLLSEIIFLRDGYCPVDWSDAVYLDVEGVISGWKTVFSAQVDIGRYRVDFLFEVVTPDKRIAVVVECDGHDYHERTKEQARRDKQRDRWLTGQGYRVLRFTGSEIWADPSKCAEEISNQLSDIVDEFAVTPEIERSREPA